MQDFLSIFFSRQKKKQKMTPQKTNSIFQLLEKVIR